MTSYWNFRILQETAQINEEELRISHKRNKKTLLWFETVYWCGFLLHYLYPCSLLFRSTRTQNITLREKIWASYSINCNIIYEARRNWVIMKIRGPDWSPESALIGCCDDVCSHTTLVPARFAGWRRLCTDCGENGWYPATCLVAFKLLYIILPN